ncbi:hypothetical protein A3781_13080 [Bacillus badius]|nr:hypothetical protein A3781_13080 [Bacillus badius]
MWPLIPRIVSVPQVEKIGVENTIEELIEKEISIETTESIRSLLLDQSAKTLTHYEKFEKNNPQTEQGIKELKELVSFLEYLNINEKCVFNPFLARGLEIYTGSIYEIFINNNEITSSIGSGGRYDNAIAGLLGTDKKFSTVGISFGLDVIYTAISKMENEPKDESIVDYYIIPINTQKEALLVAKSLRKNGFKVEVELSNKKVVKAMDKANKEKVRYVIVLGEKEVETNKFKIKDMETGEEKLMNFEF